MSYYGRGEYLQFSPEALCAYTGTYKPKAAFKKKCTLDLRTMICLLVHMIERSRFISNYNVKKGQTMISVGCADENRVIAVMVTNGH